MTEKKREPIRVRAFVLLEDGREVDVDTLPPEERRRLAAALKTAWLNALLRGRASFRMPEEPPQDARRDAESGG